MLTLTLNTGGFLNGNVSLGADSDTPSYANRSTAVSVTLASSAANGFTTTMGGATGITGTVSDINTLTGGTGMDTLTGYDADATWEIDGGMDATYTTGSGQNAETLTFRNIENLTGGAMMDTFTISTDHTGNLDGGAGDDSFTLSAGTLTGNLTGGDGNDLLRLQDTGRLTGSLSLGAGSDTLDYSARSTMVAVALTGNDVDGFAGSATDTGGFTGVNTLTAGSAMDDALTGYNTDATWTLDGGASETYDPAGSSNPTISFTNFEDLAGGAMADTFDVSTFYIGSLSGGAGDDVFTLSNALFGNLNGGDGDDAFTINTGGSLTGTVALGAGSDSFSYGNRSTIVAVTLTGSDADGFAGSATDTGGFTGVNTLTAGSAMDDALTGYNVAATWTVATAGNTYGTGTGQNARSLTFSGFENLTGGAMADTFEIRTNHRGNINSSAGDDIVALYGSVTLTGVVNLGAGGGDFLQFNNLGSGDFTLTGSDATGFSGTHSAITGGFRGVNSLAANDPPTGGAVHNLIGLNRNATWTSDSQGIRYAVTEGTTTRSLGLFHFEQFTGGTGNDTFNVGFNDDIDINGGAGDDRFNLSGLITGNLTGGPGDDVLTLTLNTGGFLNGNVSLGADSDTPSYANRSTAVSVTLASSAANGFTTTMGGATGITGTVSDINTLTGGTGMDTLTGYDADATWEIDGGMDATYTTGSGQNAETLTFRNIENLTGGAMMDTFTISTDHTGNLDGGAGDDSFTLSAGTLTGNLTGGDGNDTVILDGDARLVGDITLGTGDDTLTFASADVRFFGLADGGPGMDTLNGLQLFTEASATTIFRFRNFENVNGETELLTNLPVVAITENNGARGFAPRPVAPVVPPVVPMPQPPAPVVPPVVPPMPITPVNPMPVAPVGPMPPATGTDSQPITPPPPGTPTPGTGTGTGTTTPPTPGTGTGTGTTPPPTGGTGTPPPLTTGTGTGTTTPPTPGTGTGTGTTPPPTGGTATPPPPSPTDFAVLAAAYCEATGTACQPATATRPATVTPTPPALPDPTTLPDEPARAAARDRFQSQVESYVYVDPTGPSVQASAVGALTTTINTLISQRLSAYRRAARPPVQVAATALLPGMLARGEDPLIWGELFASDRQRGRDGRTLSYSHEYRGVLFGAEQRYGQEAVLGLMLGYADADVSTHITALNVETGSLFGGVYGRLDLAGLAVDVGLNLGYEEHDNQRFIPQQRQTAETSTHSFFINPSLTVSQSYRVEALSGRATFRLTPSLSMSYTAAFYGDYTERGAAGFNLSVDSRTAHNLTTRLQLGGDWALPKSNSGLGLRLGLQSRFTDSSDFEGTLSGASFSYASDADKSVHSLYVGVDGRHELRDNLKLLVDVEYNHDVGEVSERALSGIVRLEYAY